MENGFGKKFYFKTIVKNFWKNCFGQCVARIQDFNFKLSPNFAFLDWRLELNFEAFWINSFWERVRLLTFVYRISIIFSGPTLKHKIFFLKICQFPLQKPTSTKLSFCPISTLASMCTISKHLRSGVTICYWEGLEQKKINLLLAEREKWKMVLEKKFTYNWSGPIFEKSILGSMLRENKI